MVFKKKKISTKNKSNLISYILGILGVFMVFSVGAFLQNKVSDIKFNIYEDISYIAKNSVKRITNNIIKSDNSEENKKVNIILVGRGGGDHDAPDLTDTIIVFQVDMEKGLITLLSIPRDLYVDYNNNNKSGKINEIYMLDSIRFGSKELGMKSLQKKVGEIIGEKISYYINIDFEGFKKIIDTFGGVEVDVPENFVDNKFPDGKLGYTTFVLRKGKWLLDGDVALKYARSRHSTSDFNRSIRQQQIISSFKNKIVNNGFLKNATKLKKMYDISNKYLDTNLDFKTILRLGLFGKNSDNIKINSFNLNDSCFYGSLNCERGGLLYTPIRDLFGGISVLLVNGTSKIDLSNYQELHKFTNIIFRRPELFNEFYQIKILNGTKINNLASKISSDFDKYGFNIPKINSIGNAGKIYNNSIIYYSNLEEKSFVIKELNNFFTGDIIKKQENIVQPGTGGIIEVILGNDFEKVFLF